MIFGAYGLGQCSGDVDDIINGVLSFFGFIRDRSSFLRGGEFGGDLCGWQCGGVNNRSLMKARLNEVTAEHILSGLEHSSDISAVVETSCSISRNDHN